MIEREVSTGQSDQVMACLSCRHRLPRRRRPAGCRACVSLHQRAARVRRVHQVDPPPHDHIAVVRADLEREAPTSQLLGRGQLRAAASERLVIDITRLGLLPHRDLEDLQRLGRGMGVSSRDVCK